MKAYVVLYETVQGDRKTILLFMRKVYRSEETAVMSWQDGIGLSEPATYHFTNQYTVADCFLTMHDDDYAKIITLGEVLFRGL